MHIVFFNRSFYPDIAATGQLLTELCEDLVQVYNCQVSVVAGAPLLPSPERVSQCQPGLFFDREVHQGITILRAKGTTFSKRHVLGRASNYLSYFLSACYTGLLRLERPDVIVAFTDPPIIGLAAYLAARRFGVPLIMVYQDIYPEITWLLEELQSETLNHLLHQVNCFLVGQATWNITIGETMRHQLIERKGADPAKTVVIPNWADCTAIRPRPKRNPFSRTHGLENAFVVMHSGNIGLSQGLDTLVQAAAYLRSWPEIQIVLIGEGVKKPALEAQVRRLGLSNVRFLPFQPQAALHESYASADVFIVSLKPGLAGYMVPSKLYGILAAGRPYVAAVEPDCEVSAMTQRYRCGLRIEPEAPRALADQILYLFQHRDIARQLGRNARRAALAFDRQRQVRAYYDLFRNHDGVHHIAA